MRYFVALLFLLVMAQYYCVIPLVPVISLDMHNEKKTTTVQIRLANSE